MSTLVTTMTFRRARWPRVRFHKAIAGSAQGGDNGPVCWGLTPRHARARALRAWKHQRWVAARTRTHHPIPTTREVNL